MAIKPFLGDVSLCSFSINPVSLQFQGWRFVMSPIFVPSGVVKTSSEKLPQGPHTWSGQVPAFLPLGGLPSGFPVPGEKEGRWVWRERGPAPLQLLPASTPSSSSCPHRRSIQPPGPPPDPVCCLAGGPQTHDCDLAIISQVLP